MGWPAEEMEFMGDTFFFPDLQADHDAVEWLVVLDLGEWQMQPIAWHSPAHLRVAANWKGLPFPSAAAATGDPVSLVVGAAQSAFFQLPKAFLDQIGSILGAGIREGSSLFETLHQLCRHVLKQEDKDLVPILGKRMLKPLDDTIQVFDDEEFRANIDASDLREVDKFRDDLKAGRKSVASFEESFGSLCRKHGATSSAAASSGSSAPPGQADSGRGKGKGRGRPRGRGIDKSEPKVQARSLPVPADELSQEDALLFMPPGATIFKDLKNNRWRASMMHYSPKSRSWPLYGELKAFALVCHWSWEKCEVLTGAKCPHEWVLQMVAGVEAAGSAAAT